MVNKICESLWNRSPIFDQIGVPLAPMADFLKIGEKMADRVGSKPIFWKIGHRIYAHIFLPMADPVR